VAAARGDGDGFRGRVLQASELRQETGGWVGSGRVKLRRSTRIVFPFLLDKEKEIVLVLIFFRLNFDSNDPVRIL
jgi:hypothetical protein